MANALSQLKDQMDLQVAQVQSGIGQFLMQKERILNLPASLTKSSLLNNQNSLESRATQVVADASAFKAKIPDHFDPFNINQYKAVPGLVREAAAIGKNLVSLKNDMGRHVSSVNNQAGSAPSPLVTQTLSQNSNNILAYAALAVAALWLWKKK